MPCYCRKSIHDLTAERFARSGDSGLKMYAEVCYTAPMLFFHMSSAT